MVATRWCLYETKLCKTKATVREANAARSTVAALFEPDMHVSRASRVYAGIARDHGCQGRDHSRFGYSKSDFMKTKYTGKAMFASELTALSGYIYTIDETPYSTCERMVDGKPRYRQPDTGKVRRYIKRHRVV